MSQPYLSLEAELHDAFWAAEDDGSEIPLMAEMIRRHPGPALEIGCGSGRLLLPLLEQGFEIEGLELSADMLERCRQRAADLSLRPTLHQGDMSYWEPGKRFSCLLAPAFTLQLAADPEATLRHWHRLLEPGGGLYLTTFIPFAELEHDLPENRWYEDHKAILPDGRQALLKTRHWLDREQQVLVREHRYQISGAPPREHESRQRLRWFLPQQLVKMLGRCGFEVRQMFGDFDPNLAVAHESFPDYDGIVTCLALRRP